jgi:O-antigen/teichoic acid export membrane protein
MMGYGFVSLVAVMLWNINSHISFYLVNRKLTESDAGVYFAYLRLAQTIFMIGNAAWAVLLVHVARRWETGCRVIALYILETAYKAIALAIMTLTIIVYVTSPWWTVLLKPEYRPGIVIVGPLLMSFQVLVNMAFMTMLAKIHERPSVIVLTAALGGVANVLLVYCWIDRGILGAAYGAAFGMLTGVGIVCILYPLLSKTKLHLTTYAMIIIPLLLLLPKIWCSVVWVMILISVIFSPFVFDKEQKKDLIDGMKQMLSRARAALAIARRKNE